MELRLTAEPSLQQKVGRPHTSDNPRIFPAAAKKRPAWSLKALRINYVKMGSGRDVIAYVLELRGSFLPLKSKAVTREGASRADLRM